MIDLDAANANENDENDDNNSDEEPVTYKIGEPIFQYTEEQAQGRQFLRMYARGCSRKEAFDKNEKLFVYFLHEGMIFSWI